MTRTILPELPAQTRSGGGKRPFGKRAAAAPVPAVEPDGTAAPESPEPPVATAVPHQSLPVHVPAPQPPAPEPVALPEHHWATDALAEAAQWTTDDLPAAPYAQAGGDHDQPAYDPGPLWHAAAGEADDAAAWDTTDAFSLPTQPVAWEPEPAAVPVPVAAAPVAHVPPPPAPEASAPEHSEVAATGRPRTSSPIVPAAAGLAVLGAVGGWAAARYAGPEPLVLAGFAWWVASAVVLSLLVKRSATNAAVVSLFLFVFAGLPVVAGATAQGMAQRVSAVMAETFEDFSADLDAELDAVSSGG